MESVWYTCRGASCECNSKLGRRAQSIMHAWIGHTDAYSSIRPASSTVYGHLATTTPYVHTTPRPHRCTRTCT
jgi:hypothetical protein